MVELGNWPEVQSCQCKCLEPGSFKDSFECTLDRTASPASFKICCWWSANGKLSHFMTMWKFHIKNMKKVPWSSNSLIQFDDQHGTKSHRMRLHNSVTMMFCSDNRCLPHLVQHDPLKEVVGGRSGSPTNYHLLIVNTNTHVNPKANATCFRGPVSWWRFTDLFQFSLNSP